MWKERTDPKKYVIEDLAIAAYLLVLWDEERTLDPSLPPQTFIDLGCGNGLLVHILTMEGHQGESTQATSQRPSTHLQAWALICGGGASGTSLDRRLS